MFEKLDEYLKKHHGGKKMMELTNEQRNSMPDSVNNAYLQDIKDYFGASGLMLVLENKSSTCIMSNDIEVATYLAVYRRVQRTLLTNIPATTIASLHAAKAAESADSGDEGMVTAQEAAELLHDALGTLPKDLKKRVTDDLKKTIGAKSKTKSSKRSNDEAEDTLLDDLMS